MGGFTVDTGALRTFGSEISQVSNDLAAAVASSQLSDSDTGNHDVGDALSEFHSHWKQQQDKLRGNLTELSTTISGAADDYDKSDTAVSTGASGGAEQ
jgi:uncharacterized protein YukE